MDRIRGIKAATRNRLGLLLALLQILLILLVLPGTGSAAINGLDPNNSYFFSATTYNSSGLEGVFFNIVDINEPIPASVSILLPSDVDLFSGIIPISVSASEDVGVTKVQLFVNGVQSAETATAPYVIPWDTSAYIRGDYAVLVKAFDAGGNEAVSDAVTVTVAGDTTPPAVVLSSPADNAAANGSVIVSASANDNVDVTRVELYVDDTLVLASDQSTASYVWDTVAVSNGSHVLSAKAYDAAGNVGGSASVTVNVFNDMIAPNVSSFSLPASANSTNVLIASLTATDNVDVTGYLVSESASAPTAAAGAWTAVAPTSFSFAGAGSRTAYVWAKDAAGNVSVARSASVTITLPDTTAPSVSAFFIPATSSTLVVPVSSFTATDNVGVTGYLITESASAPPATASPWTTIAPASFTFAGAGIRTAYAWAKDAAGNVSPSSAASVLIDTILPTIAPISLSSAGWNVTIKASANDNIAVTKMELYADNSLQMQTSDSSISYVWRITDRGTHILSVKAYDAAGNVGTQSVSVSK